MPDEAITLELEGETPEAQPQEESPPDTGAGPVAETEEGTKERTAMMEAIEQGIAAAPSDSVISESPDTSLDSGNGAAPADPTSETRAAPTDENTLPIPEDEFTPEEMAALNERTRTRFQKLTTNFHDSRDQLRDLANKTIQMRDMWLEAGFDANAQAAVLEYGKMLKTGNRQGAENFLKAQLENIAVHMPGPAPEGVDLTSRYTDLTRKVEDLELTQEDANEIAQGRQRQEQAQQQQQQQHQTQTQHNQTVQHINSAKQQIIGLESQWKASDADWKHKEDHMVKFATEVLPTVDPRYWVQAVNQEYARATNSLAAFAQQSRGKRDPNALRPSGGTGAPIMDAKSDNMGDSVFSAMGMSAPTTK